MENPYRRRMILKIVVIGDAGVGKTSLISQYVNRSFSESYKATIGADFLIKDFDLDGHKITVRIF